MEFHAKYKGCLFPTCIENASAIIEKNLSRDAIEMIEDAEKNGYDREYQECVYRNQIHKIAFLLGKYERYNHKKKVKRLEKELGQSWGLIQNIWFLNIFAMLELKTIQNDTQNGWFKVDANKMV